MNKNILLTIFAGIFIFSMINLASADIVVINYGGDSFIEVPSSIGCSIDYGQSIIPSGEIQKVLPDKNIFKIIVGVLLLIIFLVITILLEELKKRNKVIQKGHILFIMGLFLIFGALCFFGNYLINIIYS